MSHDYNYDIVIAGGGMVGAAFACALGNSDLRIAVLENRPPEPPSDEIDYRVSAISIASQRILESIGAWPNLATNRLGPIRAMQVWQANGNSHGQIKFDSADLGEPTLGWIIENRVLQYALWRRAESFDNIDLLCPTELTYFATNADGLSVQLNTDRNLHCQLLVGADGGHSKVRTLAAIDAKGWGYQQQGVVCTVETEKSHQQTAWQRFLATGPLAFLPLHDGQCSIVWSTSPDHAQRLLAMPDNVFANTLAEAFDHRLGLVTAVGPRAAFPLRLQYAQSYVKPHIALIGDAAHVVHPLAGQGVNLGFLDAAALVEVVLAAHDKGRSLGGLSTLRRYERWRKGHNLMMMATLDGFERLFSNPLPPVRWLRGVGLNITDSVTPVKNLFARHAMGLSGDLPRLARS